MSADVALNPAMRRHYPFNRPTEPANILIMPGLLMLAALAATGIMR